MNIYEPNYYEKLRDMSCYPNYYILEMNKDLDRTLLDKTLAVPDEL